MTNSARTIESGDMDMHADNACKLSMTWNWYTIDACFLSTNWRITSAGMFAGSCIGVVLLVVALELLQRQSRAYDRYIRRKLIQNRNLSGNGGSAATAEAQEVEHPINKRETRPGVSWGALKRDGLGFRPTVLQQMVRTLLLTMQVGVAYILMLIAMSFNGYLLACILVGTFLGGFAFRYDTVNLRNDEDSTMRCG